MNKYLIVISHPTDALARFEAVVSHLSQNKTRRVVPLLPHAILFEHEGHTSAAYNEVATCLGPLDQVLVFHVLPVASGSLTAGQMGKVNELLA
jgi:hypothetical protein